MFITLAITPFQSSLPVCRRSVRIPAGRRSTRYRRLYHRFTGYYRLNRCSIFLHRLRHVLLRDCIILYRQRIVAAVNRGDHENLPHMQKIILSNRSCVRIIN